MSVRTTLLAKAPLAGLLLALALTLASPSPAAADLGGFVIKEFHSNLTVEPNADLVVEERIEVEFLESRHGIYRRIPIRYTDPRGFSYSVGFKLLGVTDDGGQKHGTKTSHERQYVRIRIGDADRTVTGRQVYVIRYRVRDAIGHFAEHDELYWNAIGDEWFTTIERASATVHLPDGVPSDAVETAVYTGYAGLTDRDATITERDAGAISYAASRTLEPQEGLTVVAAWPHGYVTFPSAISKWLRRLVDNFTVLLPFLSLAWLSWRYRRFGRDPEDLGTVVVRYEPPEGMTPAEVGTVVDEDVDMRDITAVLVDLAVRGYLTISMEATEHLLWTSQETVFERIVEKDAADLLPHEQKLLDGLFADGDIVTSDDLRARFYTKLPGIRDAVYERLVDQGLFSSDPSGVRTRYVLYGILAGFLIFAAGAVWSWLRGGIPPLAFAIPLMSGVVTAVIFMAFAPAMPRRTEAGVRLRGWALGFEEFVDRVESDRLERDEARNVFEAMLPYAMALGVAAVWARKFEGIYEERGPTWYAGPYMAGSFTTSSFEQSLTSAMSSTAGTMAEAPRSSGSSGSGGGGFSGGGFGGGGGGSW